MVYTCPDCNGSFQNAGEFCAHYNECHSNESSKSSITNKKYKCNFCDYRSDRTTDIKRHMKSKHREQETSLIEKINKLVTMGEIKEWSYRLMNSLV